MSEFDRKRGVKRGHFFKLVLKNYLTNVLEDIPEYIVQNPWSFFDRYDQSTEKFFVKGIAAKQREGCSPLDGAVRRKSKRSGVLSVSAGRTNGPAEADPYRSAPLDCQPK